MEDVEEDEIYAKCCKRKIKAADAQQRKQGDGAHNRGYYRPDEQRQIEIDTKEYVQRCRHVGTYPEIRRLTHRHHPRVADDQVGRERDNRPDRDECADVEKMLHYHPRMPCGRMMMRTIMIRKIVKLFHSGNKNPAKAVSTPRQVAPTTVPSRMFRTPPRMTATTPMNSILNPMEGSSPVS